MKRIKLVISFVLVACFCVGLYGTNVKATSKEDLEAQLALIDQKQKELESQMAEVRDDLSKQEEYQEYLWEQIELTREEISVREERIDLLEDEIDTLESDIDGIEDDIVQKQQEIDDGIELFQERVRALYIAGDDSMLSLLLGSTDFYNVLANAEYIRRVTEHDQTMLDGLLEDKQEMEQYAQDLVDKKNQVTANIGDLETAKEEFAQKQEQLSASYSESQAIIQELEGSEDELAAAQSQNQAQYDAIDAEIQRIIDAERAKNEAMAYAGGQLNWPVPGHYRISSPFGSRYLFGYWDFHTGIDIVGTTSGVIKGASIVAANDGRVLVAEKYSNSGYGHYVLIDHGVNANGQAIYTLYGHMQSVDVNVGDTVSRGSHIGTVGTTGLSTGYHLHFEVRIDNQKVDPQPYLLS